MDSAYETSLAISLTVGIVQTSLDPAAAWTKIPKMERLEEEQAITEIRGFLSAMNQKGSSPDIIIFPELAVPTGYERHLRRMATAMQSVIIAGLDYRQGSSVGDIHNEAVIIVPKRWRGVTMGANTTTRRIGKTYPAPEEKRKLLAIAHDFKPNPSIWLFDGGAVGTFGVMVCYDFLDVERIAMYRGKVQHLFILALNKDATSFNHVAEAVSRMIFCNVVICNCGHYGGSMAVSPYRFSERRTIYRHVGGNLATAQIIDLPVASLDMHQHYRDPLLDGVKEYKSLPPGYEYSGTLGEK